MSRKSNKTKPAPELLTLEAEAQEVLDQLWSEEALPFPLSVGKLTKGMGEYTIDFHDSRIRTTRILLNEGQSFRDMVRESVLARVAQMSGPLKDWKK